MKTSAPPAVPSCRHRVGCTVAVLGVHFAMSSFVWSQPAGATNAIGAALRSVVDPTMPARPGILTSTDPARPPPFANLAGSASRGAADIDPATKAIPPGRRAKVDADHADWLVKKGGAAFRSHLSYFGGRPLLLLFSRSDEPALVKVRRLQAIVEACDTHLNDEAFDRTIISIAEVNALQPDKVTTRNVEVRRAEFQAAVQKAGNGPNFKSALAKVRADDGAKVFAQICAALGIQ